MADPTATGTVVVETFEGGALRIHTEGPGVRPQDLMLAAAFLTRTANQMLDADALARAQTDDPKGLEIVRAMPDALRNGGH